MNLVYKENEDKNVVEENTNVDIMIVDSGTTKTVAGKEWINSYIESLPEEERSFVKSKPEERYFRFGNSVRYPSKEEVKIHIKLGKLDTELNVSIVKAKIPLLLGKPDLKRLGFTINFEEETVFVSKTFETFALETILKGHLALHLKEEECLDNEIFLMEDCK